MAKILIIEDDQPLQEAYGFILKADGHTITTAFDGKEGLQKAMKHRFDIILLDLHMPIMDGWEFLKQYEAPKDYLSKIIVFSNMVEPDLEKQAAALGAYRSVLKSSMTPSSMLTLIKEALEK